MSKKMTAVVKAATSRAATTEMAAINVDAILTRFGADATQSLVDIRVAEIERELQAKADAHRAKIETLTREIEGFEKAKGQAIQKAADDEFRAKLQTLEAAITGSGIFGVARSQLQVNGQQNRKFSVTLSVMTNGAGYHNSISQAHERDYPSEANLALDRADAARAAKQVEETELSKVRRDISKIPQFERQIRGFIGERRFSSTTDGAALLAELKTLQLK